MIISHNNLYSLEKKRNGVYTLKVDHLTAFETKGQLYNYYLSVYNILDNQIRDDRTRTPLKSSYKKIKNIKKIIEDFSVIKTKKFYTLNKRINFQGNLSQCKMFYILFLRKVQNETLTLNSKES